MSGEQGPTRRRLVVSPDHPALPGHFPGRAVVPGVLLLDAVLQATGCPTGRLLRVRFTAPVLPGEEVEIEVAPAGPAAPRRAFTCRRGGTVVLTGEVACGDGTA
jgi:3-hydroxymyristoyl/3-hydroxydecanoyl-(acyl carrier protein) dehydratase